MSGRLTKLAEPLILIALAITALSAWIFLGIADEVAEGDTQLIDDAHRIAHLPVEMVVGRYDCCCTPDNSYDLARRLPEARLVVVPGGGHYGTEPAMAQACAMAPGRLHDRIVAAGDWPRG